MSNTFLDAFLKFQTFWQWQLHYGTYSGNHCVSIVWQASIENCLGMLMDLDWPYQNWRKTLYTMSDNFAKYLSYFKKIRVTVQILKLHYKSLFSICLAIHWTSSKNKKLDWSYHNWRKTLNYIFQTYSWKHL